MSKIGPKHMVSTLITMILVFGEVNFGIVGGFDRMVAALFDVELDDGVPQLTAGLQGSCKIVSVLLLNARTPKREDLGKKVGAAAV